MERFIRKLFGLTFSALLAGVLLVGCISNDLPRNALTFIQKGDADSLFRKFLIDNIKEAECCPVHSKRCGRH